MATKDVLGQVRQNAGNTQKSSQWYVNQVRKLVGGTYPAPRFQDDYKRNLTNNPLPGRMYLFKYDPVGKGTTGLPYYDTFPLVIPWDIASDRFIGINFHYLYPLVRIQLLEKLSQYKVGTTDLNTRIRADWRILGNISRFKEVRPSVKIYLRKQVRSRFLFIQPDDWTTASILPTEKFVGAGKSSVFVQSSRKMRKK